VDGLAVAFEGLAVGGGGGVPEVDAGVGGGGEGPAVEGEGAQLVWRVLEAVQLAGGGGVPDSGGAVGAEAGEAAVRRVGEGFDLALVAFEFAVESGGGGIPELDGLRLVPVAAGGGECLAVRARGDGVELVLTGVDAVELLAGADVVDSEESVVAGGGDVLAVGRPGEGGDGPAEGA
jgi:hypothetical protein